MEEGTGGKRLSYTSLPHPLKVTENSGEGKGHATLEEGVYVWWWGGGGLTSRLITNVLAASCLKM